MKCRHCGQPLHLPFLDLGSAPPSNAYLSEAALRAPEVWFPLRVLVCTHCWLVQTEDHAGREALFTHDYAYARSAEVIHGPVMETLVWARVPGDIVFGIGAFAFAIFVAQAFWSTRKARTAR